LRKANLINADILLVFLADSNLSDANLSNTNLSNTNLNNAQLSRVNLTKAKLRDVSLISANLMSINLSNADLNLVNLNDANLSYGNFSNTNLQSVIYNNKTKWKSATYDQNTKFPKGFNPKQNGMIFKSTNVKSPQHKEKQSTSPKN
jgi:uncharacterized protein YjbI with pentapeptide repeats